MLPKPSTAITVLKVGQNHLGNLLEKHVLRSHPRPDKSETLGVRPRNLSFNRMSK